MMKRSILLEVIFFSIFEMLYLTSKNVPKKILSSNCASGFTAPAALSGRIGKSSKKDGSELIEQIHTSLLPSAEFV